MAQPSRSFPSLPALAPLGECGPLEYVPVASKTSNVHRSTEPPMMSFDIADAVFVHSIRFDSRLPVNTRTARSCTFKVSIDVVNLNIHTAAYT